MLFSQIVAFILVMAVFEAYRPEPPSHGLWESVSWCVVLTLMLLAGSRAAVVGLLRRLAGPRPPRDPARAARRLQFYLQAAALAALLIMFTGLELKANLLDLPVLGQSEVLPGLAAVGLYFLLLGLVEWACHPLQAWVLGQSLDLRAHLGGQLRFLAPVVFPWLMVALLRDLAALASPTVRVLLDTPLGDLVFLAAFLLMMAVLFPPLVRHWWGCRPLPAGPARQLIELVLKKAGVSVAGVLAWPALQGRMLTAGILGLFPGLRYLLITPALIETLSAEELAGVAAHEAGHVRHRHLLAYLGFFLGFFVLAYALAEPLNLLNLLAASGLAGSAAGARFLMAPNAGQGLISVLLALPLVLVMLLYLRFVMGFFMRHFERQADLFALDLLGAPAPLVGALEKIGRLTGNSRDVPSWHHFSIAQRVRALMEARGGQGNAQAQGRVIRRGLLVYALGLAFTVAMGLGLQALDLGQGLRQAVLLKLFEERLQEAPHDPRLRMSLGATLFEQGEEEAGMEQVRLALALAPGDPEILNALAWMLATAADSDLREPQEALALAAQAVALSPAPHIWDTLAEAHYVNGQYAKASAAARAALAAGPKERREYYQAQLERFARAAGERP